MENAALKSILPFAGLPEDRLQDVSFSGDFDPHLPTSFKITETGIASPPPGKLLLPFSPDAKCRRKASDGRGSRQGW